MKRRDYYNKLKETVDNGFTEYQIKLKEYNKLKTERIEGHYSLDYLSREIIPRMNSLRAELTGIQNKVKAEARRLTDIKKADFENAERLNPADLTDDVKLLQGGLILTQRDIEGILERNSSNRTMIQLAVRYAKEHGLKLSHSYNDTKEDQKQLDDICGAIGTVVKWYDTDNINSYQNVYNAVFTEDFYNACDTDQED